MHIIWKNHAHTNENLRTSFSAPTSFLIGCGRMMIFWARATKKLRGVSLHLSFFWLVVSWKKCCIFFVKLGLLSNLDINIVTSIWPFWQMSSLLHHAPFQKKKWFHQILENWRKKNKTKVSMYLDTPVLLYTPLAPKKTWSPRNVITESPTKNGVKITLGRTSRMILQWRGSHHLRTWRNSSFHSSSRPGYQPPHAPRAFSMNAYQRWKLPIVD